MTSTEVKSATRTVNRKGAVVLWGRYYYNKHLLQMAGQAVEIRWPDVRVPQTVEIYCNGVIICDAYLDEAIL